MAVSAFEGRLKLLIIHFTQLIYVNQTYMSNKKLYRFIFHERKLRSVQSEAANKFLRKRIYFDIFFSFAYNHWMAFCEMCL